LPGRLPVDMSLLTDFQQRVLPVRDKLYRFALRMLGSVEEAEDVVQEVLIRIWDRRQDMHTYLNIEAWCMRMTKNLSLDLIKGRKYFVDTDHIEKNGLEAIDSPERHLEAKDALKQIAEIIDQLPAKQQMAIQLRDIEGYSYQEIADIMEISLSQVKVNLHRARTIIRERMTQLEKHGLS